MDGWMVILMWFFLLFGRWCLLLIGWLDGWITWCLLLIDDDDESMNRWMMDDDKMEFNSGSIWDQLGSGSYISPLWFVKPNSPEQQMLLFTTLVPSEQAEFLFSPSNMYYMYLFLLNNQPMLDMVAGFFKGMEKQETQSLNIKQHIFSTSRYWKNNTYLHYDWTFPQFGAFQIFPGAHGVPLARLGGATIDAKFDELCHGVRMVITGLVTGWIYTPRPKSAWQL